MSDSIKIDEDETLAPPPVTRVGIMIDQETLGLGPRAVSTQMAFIAFDLDDPSNRFRKVHEYLPLEPQIKTLSRVVSASTILFWMKQSDEARAGFEHNTGDDFDELNALVMSVNRKMGQVIEGKQEVQLFARGQDFDFPIWESLLGDLGQSPPYRYDAASDLRTLMREAGITKKNVNRPAAWVEHHALFDCEYQIDCLAEAWRRIRARV